MSVKVRKIAPDPETENYYADPKGKSWRMCKDWCRDTRGRKYDSSPKYEPLRTLAVDEYIRDVPLGEKLGTETDE